MVNSSYTYSVFGMAFYTFAIGGLVVWLPTFLIGHAGDRRQVSASSLLGLTTVAAAIMRHDARGLAGRPAGEDQPAGPVPRARAWRMLGVDPVRPDGDLRPDEPLIFVGIFLAEALMFINTGPCNAIIANVVMPNMRAAAYAVAIFAVHFLGDIWSPTLIGWVADTFGQADTMATRLRPGPGGHRRRADGPARPAPPRT